MKLAKNAGLELVEEAVSLQKSTEMDALLITGTSPKVLPVSSLDDHSYNTQIEVIEKIIVEYQKIFDNYIQSNLKQLA